MWNLSNTFWNWSLNQHRRATIGAHELINTPISTPTPIPTHSQQSKDINQNWLAKRLTSSNGKGREDNRRTKSDVVDAYECDTNNMTKVSFRWQDKRTSLGLNQTDLHTTLPEITHSEKIHHTTTTSEEKDPWKGSLTGESVSGMKYFEYLCGGVPARLFYLNLVHIPPTQRFCMVVWQPIWSILGSNCPLFQRIWIRVRVGCGSNLFPPVSGWISYCDPSLHPTHPPPYTRARTFIPLPPERGQICFEILLYVAFESSWKRAKL